MGDFATDPCDLGYAIQSTSRNGCLRLGNVDLLVRMGTRIPYLYLRVRDPCREAIPDVPSCAA